jgi:hypothetical protein
MYLAGGVSWQRKLWLTLPKGLADVGPLPSADFRSMDAAVLQVRGVGSLERQ